MDNLRCNSLKCRKPLSLENTAVVTTCSHIFCVECANALFSVPQICPACDNSLPESDDVVQTSLNPPDAYKTSVLSGLSPVLILEIASRALNFYTYQMSQESAFQALVTKNAQERISVLEAQCNNIIREATSEINLLKERVVVSDRDLELERRKVRELQETHKTNAKAYNKLKAQYDKVQQRAILAPVNMNTFAGGNPQLQSNKVFTSGFASQSSTPLRGGGGSVRQTSQQSFTSASLAVPSSSQRIRRSLHEQNNNSFPGTDNDGVRAETGIQDSGYGVSNRGGAGEIRDYSKERRSNKRPSRQNNNNASTFQLPEFLGQPSRSHGAGSAQVQQSKSGFRPAGF